MSVILSSRLCSRPLPFLPTNASPFSSPSSSLTRTYSFHNNAIKQSALPRPQQPPPPPTSFFSSSSRNTPTGRKNYNIIRVSAGGGVGGWFSALGGNKRTVEFYTDVVKAGDPVLHEPCRMVDAEEIASDAVQKTIDDMVRVMRKAPGVGLAAPQIGVPLRIIVLEDTKEYISYASKKEVEAQDRRPFDLLVIINPKLEKKGNETALFFEGCLSVDGFRAIVERHLKVEVTGLDRKGNAIKVEASGWQARILQHECDHLDGTIYVDRMLARSFRTVENLTLPLPAGCPELGPI